MRASPSSMSLSPHINDVNRNVTSRYNAIKSELGSELGLSPSSLDKSSAGSRLGASEPLPPPPSTAQPPPSSTQHTHSASSDSSDMYQFYSNPRPNSKQWGWFEEEKPQSDSDSYPDLQSLNTLPAPSADSQQTPVMHNIHYPSSSLNMSVGTPDYVLSESTSSQRLWSQTAR